MKVHQPYRKQRIRRLWLVVVVCAVLLIVAGLSGVFTSKNTVKPIIQASQKRISLPKNVQLSWPAIGQAAVGSVEDGLLVHSTANETIRPTASMAKVITALAILEKRPFSANRTYTLTANDVALYRAYVASDGSVLPVYEGMVITEYQALQMMLVASANNIADTLAERTFGSEAAYISYAQNMLKRMGLSQTTVADASGFSPRTVSTPSDLVKIGIAALKNPVIAEIVAQPQTHIPGVGIIKNTNELLGSDGVIGIKTGTTHQAGSCLLFAARYTGTAGQKVTLVGVIVGDVDAQNLFVDARQLLASARQGFGLADNNE